MIVEGDRGVDVADRVSWFRAPTDISEAVDAVANGSRVLAGGTDLVASMNLGGDRPAGVVWIGHLGLNAVESDHDVLRIGAAVSLGEIASDAAVLADAGALASAAGRVAGPAVRNLATVGGSLCAAWPRSDIGCAALALGGVLIVVGPSGERQVPMSDFYTGPRQTVVGPDEIVTQLHISPSSSTAFIKIGRRSAMSLPVVNAAVRMELDDEDAVSQIAVAVGVGHYPERAPTVERALLGRVPDTEIVAAASAQVLDDVQPVDDEHATAWYRSRVAPVAVSRAISAVVGGTLES